MTLFRQTPAPAWRTDEFGTMVEFNPAWYRLRNSSPTDEIRGEPPAWLEAIHPADRAVFLAAHGSSLRHGRPFSLEIRLHRGDSTFRWIACRGAPIRNRDGRITGLIGSAVDISDSLELDEVVQRQGQLDREATRRREHLLTALSHDARTPLNAVVLATQLLEYSLRDQADPDISRSLGTIRDAVGNVLDLLDDLLDIGRIDAGIVVARPSRFSLGPFLVECMASISPQCAAKGLHFEVEVGPLASAMIETDRIRLKQILSELLSNALRFTRRGTIRLYATMDPLAGDLHIGVDDTGVGIEPSDGERIFEDFATLDLAHRPVGQGKGLGLAICRRLANLLHGELHIESVPDVGSRFFVTLPSVVLANHPSEPECLVRTANRRALIVHGSVQIRQQIATLLSDLDYQIDEASNGRDALDRALTCRPDIVLMGCEMPIMDGIDATHLFQTDARLKELPIVALTTDLSPFDRRRFLLAGAAACLDHPTDPRAVRAILATIDPGGAH